MRWHVKAMLVFSLVHITHPVFHVRLLRHRLCRIKLVLRRQVATHKALSNSKTDNAQEILHCEYIGRLTVQDTRCVVYMCLCVDRCKTFSPKHFHSWTSPWLKLLTRENLLTLFITPTLTPTV